VTPAAEQATGQTQWPGAWLDYPVYAAFGKHAAYHPVLTGGMNASDWLYRLFKVPSQQKATSTAWRMINHVTVSMS